MMARRREPSGKPSSAIPTINKPAASGQVLQVIGGEAVSVRPAYLISLPSIAGFMTIMALSEKVTEPPPGTVMGVAKLNSLRPPAGETHFNSPPTPTSFLLN